MVLVGIAGSTRRGSYNAALLRALAGLAPEGCRIEIASLAGVPLYDGDLEAAEGIPAPVAALKDRVAAADGLLLCTPEYNHSLPGVFKNAIDWMSRPPADIARVFGGRPVALCGATPGPGGTRMAQTAWLPVLRALGVRPFFEKALYVGGAKAAFDPDGRLIDAALADRARDFIAGFAKFVKR